MMDNAPIQPLNVAAATLLIQLVLVLLLSVTSWLHSSTIRLPGGRYLTKADQEAESIRRSPMIFVFIISFAVLLVSDEFYGIWGPLFKGVGINTLPTISGIGFVFIIDLLLVGYLMAISGGSRYSPFTSTLFTIPSLAIFLRLPPNMFFTYAVIASIVYLVFMYIQSDPYGSSGLPSVFMNISCLFLAMLTGYITRPVPINQLKKSVSIERKVGETENKQLTMLDLCYEEFIAAAKFDK
jgi:hypothetical protein